MAKTAKQGSGVRVQGSGKSQAPDTRHQTLSPAEFHALKIASKEAEKLRDKLAVGPGQAIDVTLRITGAINVAPENTFDKNLKPSAEDVLAVVLGAVGERSAKAISTTLIDTYGNLAADAERERPIVEADFLETAAELISSCTIRRPRSQNGAVTGSLKVEKVG